MENTKAYPWTPNEALRESLENSSYKFTTVRGTHTVIIPTITITFIHTIPAVSTMSVAK
jgi:hypothetical protein